MSTLYDQALHSLEHNHLNRRLRRFSHEGYFRDEETEDRERIRLFRERNWEALRARARRHHEEGG